MLYIPTSEQTRAADRYTIEHEPIASIDLMERASRAFTVRFTEIAPDKTTPILVCAGTGNNGGDGLAVARMLHGLGYCHVSVWIARFGKNESADFTANLARLSGTGIGITELLPEQPFPSIEAGFVIDALLGSGLSKPLAGDFRRLARHINTASVPVVAVDIPTGLPGEGPVAEGTEMVFAGDAISFQRPKLNFFFPESAVALARFHVVPIGLDDAFINSLPGSFLLVERDDIIRLYQKRQPFSHKGTYGHALIIAGHAQTMGAALLCAGASVYTGSGLTTACIPESGLTALNIAYPEAMYTPRENIADNVNRYDAIGIGPGLGDDASLLAKILENTEGKALVLDADAINFIAKHPEYLDLLPDGCTLTPHMKEFDRLFGAHDSWWDRVATAREKAMQHNVIILLKNRFTFIATPQGKVMINPTGNPAMASGGMGDVLTGMLTSFLAQGYPPEDAALLACYLHGATGDRLAKQGMAVVPATVLLQAIPASIGLLEEH